MKDITLKPIGKVIEMEDGFAVELKKEYRNALIETESFSHLIVLWWAHHYDSEEYRSTIITEKPYTKGPQKIGIFATRSPIRPNPVAITTIMAIKVDLSQGRIYTPCIDAEPGTPIIDIKPYQPGTDIVKDVKVPQWCSHWPSSIEESAYFNWETEFNFPS